MNEALPAGQRWSAERYARHAAFVPELGAPVLELLAPRTGERILDVGCGDGVLTARLIAAGADVVGIDASPELVAAAVARGVDARVGDAQHLAFDAVFDAAFSNAALHWMRDVDGVIAGVRRALRPGGRFVGELGGHGNVAAVSTALYAALREIGIDGAARSPWIFPTPAEYRQALEANGFAVESIELVARPTVLPTGMSGWLATFGDAFVAGLDPAARERVFTVATDLLSPVLRDRGGTWIADYVRLRFSATRR